MASRGCYHLLLVGLQGQPPASFCTQDACGGYACPRSGDETYEECHGFAVGDPLVRLFSNEGAEASAFQPATLKADPSFVQIMIEFMVPDWRKEDDVHGRARQEKKRPTFRVPEWLRLRPARPSPSPPPPPPPRRPAGPSRSPHPTQRRHHEESVLEAGAQVDPPRPEAEGARPASALRPARPRSSSESSSPPATLSHGPSSPRADGHVPDHPYHGTAVTRLARSRHYLGDLQLVERRGLLQVEWASEGAKRRPPLALLWHATFGSGNLLLGQQSASTNFLIYGTRLRKSPSDTSLWARHDVVCGLDMQHGETLWRWRDLFLACPPQVVEGVVLLRRLDSLWAVDEATGQKLWDMPAESEHAEEAGLAEGRAIFHMGKKFRAVDMQTGVTAWEAPASLYSPRPVAAGSRVVLAADDHLRAVSSPSGKDLWRVACHGPENRVPAVSEQHVVFWTWDAQLHAVHSATGKRAWSLKGRTFYPGDDPVICDGLVLVRDGDLGDAALLAIDEARGRVRWRVPLEENLSGSLGFSARQVLVLNAQGEVVSLERDTGNLLWRLQCPASAMVLAHDRLLTWSDGSLYCFEVSS